MTVITRKGGIISHTLGAQGQRRPQKPGPDRPPLPRPAGDLLWTAQTLLAVQCAVLHRPADRLVGYVLRQHIMRDHLGKE